ncbi:LLM class flavin-dependent oxidoreductase [Paenibacillus xylaniclasticus]|uniref:LLM class flavin-dependent oxidoreductase n=1 Tax=Paenibacillus xylaniclasticus TaxID=588083 RepID=UPI000FDA4045|nr:MULTISPECIES: LLM class flavin-dependent oxidoreductase [Paenibacillus]GFN30898.1 alkanesulfonate monooxygenase [Paenibacillus curdlanolyticus]
MGSLRIFSEIPCNIVTKDYKRIETVVGLAEKYNYEGALIYFFHTALDPWIVLTKVLQQSQNLSPLIAVQPYSMQPFTVAKMIASVAALYGRKININFITGVNDVELKSIGEIIDPSIKYARLHEYIEIIQALLKSDAPFSYDGQYFSFKALTNHSQISEEFFPGFYIPGSSSESIRLVHHYAGTAVLRPQPIEQFRQEYLSKMDTKKVNIALRISMIARPTSSEAWETARALYPVTSLSRLKLKMRRKVSSHNSQMMLHLASDDLYDEVYWMGAYKSGNSLDPYLVGNYEEVAEYLQKYIDSGVNALLIGHLVQEEDYYHVNEVLKRVSRKQTTGAVIHGSQ